LEPTVNRTAHRLAVGVALLLAAVALASCGSGEDETGDKALKLTFVVGSKGQATTMNAPTSAEAGLAEITLENNSAGAADLQLIRVEGDHATEEVTKAMTDAVEGKAWPDWFFAAGGVGLTVGGSSSTVTKVLQPGSYYAFNTEKPGTTDETEVTGEPSDRELPEADAVIEAGRDGEYSFTTPVLTAGTARVIFKNAGEEPHHLIAAPLVGNSTAEDAERFFKTKQGEPLNEAGFQSTAVLDSGESQLVTLRLGAGRYALYCLISDRKGGARHALKGMVDEVQVKEKPKPLENGSA